MKKLFILILLAITFAACKKGKTVAPVKPMQPNKMAGQWIIASVTVIPRDSTGKAINNGTIYPEPSYYYFQFNNDNSWRENLALDPNAGIGETGTYVLHADTGFTLINVNLPANPTECKIVSLTDTSFQFSHQRTTLFNGITPGYLEYDFRLHR